MDTDQAIQLLEQAIDGLMYTSESDEPFEVIHWSGAGEPISVKRILELSSNRPDIPVKVISTNDFFKKLTTEKEWYGESERQEMQKFINLKNIVDRSLSNTKVFKVGEVRVSIYVIGNTDQGDWVGIKTKAIET